MPTIALEAGQVNNDLDPHVAAIALSGAVYRRLMTGRPWEYFHRA